MSPVELERRRIQAADLFEQGTRQSKVAEVLGATPQAVSLWRRAWAEGGREALLSRGPGGNSIGMRWPSLPPAGGSTPARPVPPVVPKRRPEQEHHEECDRELYKGGSCTCWSIKRFGPPPERESYWDNF
ncbi:helix-turn-helix domain-containing protein [Streptomyces sp. NPDC088135]|uniref:helix-turn-helix domain-containing protein n=1 Tax=Streptomyces sp. NPDC088135 TaxID=3160993 RepID=UPI0034400FAD